MRSLSSFALIAAAAIPFLAPSVSADGSLLASILCKSTEFWYPPLATCLPNGGPVSGISKKQRKKCPKGGWYYLEEKNACAPIYPTSPLPICPQGHWWDPAHLICEMRCKGPLEFWFAERGQCVKMIAGGVVPSKTTPTDQVCADKWHWDASLNSCIPNTDDDQNNTDCEPGFVWSRATLSCQPDEPIIPPPTPSGTITRRKNATPATKCSPHDARSCGYCEEANGQTKGRDCYKVTTGIRRAQCNQGLCETLKCAKGYQVSRSGDGCERPTW